MKRMWVAAYWSGRRQDEHECANCLRQMLAHLATCHTSLSAWFDKRTGKRAPLNCGDCSQLEAIVAAGAHRRDDSGKQILELGYTVGFWNGKSRPHSAKLLMTCGCYTSVGAGGNCVLLDLPEELETLSDSRNMERLLSGIVESWNPDWAGVFSRQSTNVRDFSPSNPFLDWMVYVNRELWSLPLAGPSLEVRPMGMHGDVVIVDYDPSREDSETVRELAIEAEGAIRRKIVAQ